jgi:hypothetical protein
MWVRNPRVPVPVGKIAILSTCPGPREDPLVPVRKQPGLKDSAGTNELYKPGLKAFSPRVAAEFNLLDMSRLDAGLL